MKLTSKKFALIGPVVVLFALLSIAAQYDFYGVQTTALNGGTNNIAATSTSNYNYLVVATRSEYIPFQFSAALISGGTTLSNVFLNFQKSLDNSIWDTNYIVYTAQLGTNPLTSCFVTNFTAAGVGYYRLVSIQNTNAVALTNVSFSYAIKR